MTKTSHNLIMNSLEELKAVDTKILSLKDLITQMEIFIPIFITRLMMDWEKLEFY